MITALHLLSYYSLGYCRSDRAKCWEEGESMELGVLGTWLKVFCSIHLGITLYGFFAYTISRFFLTKHF